MNASLQMPDVSLALELPDEITGRIPYLSGLGMQYIRLPESGNPSSVFYLPFQESLVGNTRLPALHGGAVAGFMEAAAVLHLQLAETFTQRLPKTIDFHIDYLQSAGPRDTFASCEVSKLGKRVALVSIRCWQRHYDRPVALARAHYLWEALPADSGLPGASYADR